MTATFAFRRTLRGGASLFAITIARLVLICVIVVGSTARAIDYTGQVVSAADGIPIEGATITLDTTPDPGSPGVDYAGTTSPFGMFGFDSVDAGAYQVDVTRDGFLPETFSLTLTQDVLTQTIELTPDAGPERHDVYVSVKGIMTGLPAEGAAVAARLFSSAADTTGSVVANLTIDGEGNGLFRGLGIGFYEVEVTPPAGWLPFATPRVELTQTHHAAILLTPQKRDIEVIVQGHDPRVKEGDPVRTLPQVYVELTGHAEGDPDAVLVAKRSGVTVENGRVFFRGVPTVVPYKLQIKRLGYTTITETVPAVNSAARLTLNRTLAIEPHSLRVELEHPAYEKLAVFEGLEVRLVGLKETNTEGIDCTLDTGEVPNVRRFEDLVPGRYELSVDGEGTSAELTLHPHFEFVDYIELFGEGMEEMAAELTVRGNLVSGQLLAADQKAYSNKGGNQHPSDYLPAGRPRYEPKANTEITFVEYAVDPCLSPDFREITVTTDENGQFTVDLPPARYGLRMAALTDYWGSHVLLKEQGEDPLPLPVGGLPDGRQSFPAAGQGWPFAEEWPFPGSPPSNGTPLPGLPLVLDGRDFDLDVYLRKQLVSVLETISGSAAPTQSHVLGLERLPEDAGYLPIRYSDYGDLNDGGVARLVTAGGATQTGDIYPAFKPRRLEGTTVETEGFLYFEAVPPGTHTLSVEHDRFDFVLVELPFGGETTPARKTWTIPPWPAPGVLPATDPATDPAYIEPFSVIPGGGPITPDNLNFDLISGRYRAGGPITIREHHWIEPDDGSDPFYELVNTTVMEGEDAAFDYMKTGYAGGRTFDAVSIVPFGSFTFWIGNYSGSAGGGAQSFDFYAGGPMDNSLAVDEETGLPSGISLPIYDSLSGGPAETYPLRVTAINDAERDGDPVPNIAIKINNGPTLLSGGVRQVSEQPIAELFEPVEITSPPWTGVPSDETAFLFDENGQIVLGPDFRPVMINLVAHEFRDLNDTEGGIDLVPELIVYIRRGLEVTGSVTSVGEGAPGIPGATVLVRDRFGTTIGVANTDADGNWALPVGVSALQDASPPVYVDVRAPGYAPWRERFSADAIDPTQNKLAVSAALAPLPPVEIDEAIFDRTGLFLSGLYFAHNADALDALKLTWEATFDAGEQTVELIPFDDENGNPGEPEVVTASNPPVAVYLVNTVGITGHRYNATPSAIFNHKPGTEVDQGMLRTWLEDAIKRTVPNVFHTRPVQPEKVALTAYHATGEIHIWKLPPVPFRPIVVVKSANGTLSIRSDFADPTTATSAGDGDPLLDGGSVPSWLATVANAMGFMGALQDAVGGNPTPEQRQEIFDALDEAFPSGALSMLPNFTADITTVAASGNAAASALAYRYGLNLTWREGMSNPSSDWMRFLSDPLGVEFEVGAELGLDNSEERPFFLNGSGSVSAALKPEKFVPKVLRQFSFEPKATGSVNGGFEIQSTAPTAKGGLDLEISANLGATVQTTVPINLA
ncbi:MAG: carboxypeptidase-like regulatory domain-containing protein, partial [Verrucomicrobiales bacterium]